MQIYPIIIPTLCRYEHLKRCIDSLSECTLANQTELIIGLDAPSNEKHIDGYNKIKDYVNTIIGFKKVVVLTADVNLGVSKNLTRMIEYVSEKYDAYIFTEDDNEFSPCFLEFVNKMLNEFKNEKSIFAVTGYSPIIFENITDNPIIATRYAYMWGVGKWIRKGEEIQSLSFYDEKCRKLKNAIKILKEHPSALGMMLEMLESKKIYGDVIRTVENILEDRYMIMPNESMVRNIGYDGSGLHCGVNNSYLHQKIQTNKHFCYDNVNLTQAITEAKRFKQIRKSYFLMLSSNKIKSLFQISRIIIKWIVYTLKRL